jgi:hypothetical protein
MTLHRGGFGVGPIHSVEAFVSAVQSGKPRGTNGGAASKPPAHLSSPKVRRTTFSDAVWCPAWVRKMVLDDASIEDVVHAAVKRVKRHETEETLMEVETLLNELTRSPEYARKVRDALAPEVIADVLKRGATS